MELIGRFLRNYGSMGILEKASALLFARPMRYSMEARWRPHAEIRRILLEFGRQDMPVVANMDFGHTSPQMVLPLGCSIRIDSQKKQIKLLEKAVVNAPKVSDT